MSRDEQLSLGKTLPACGFFSRRPEIFFGAGILTTACRKMEITLRK
jgi:hypothetical protein